MMKQIANYIRNNFQEKFNSFSRISRALLMAGALTMILLGLGCIVFMLFLLATGNGDPSPWYIAFRLLEQTLGVLLFSVLVPCVVEFVRR